LRFVSKTFWVALTVILMAGSSVAAAQTLTGKGIAGGGAPPVLTARILGINARLNEAQACFSQGKLLDDRNNACAFVAAPAHERQGDQLRFQQALDGVWAELSDNLTGPQGPGCNHAICFPPPPPVGEPIAPPPGCLPLASQQQVVACPGRGIGNITRQRDDTCNRGPGSFGPWYAIINNCMGEPCVPSNETRTVACSAGYTGGITEAREFQCPGKIWTPWQPVSHTCACTDITAETAVCGAGQTGNKTRTVSCGVPGAWNTSSCTQAAPDCGPWVITPTMYYCGSPLDIAEAESGRGSSFAWACERYVKQNNCQICTGMMRDRNGLPTETCRNR